ncbi:MAG: substrate-binding domain-containing protein [Actinobacteria bacterium]|nr:substrate-binding domain-containing protein [Actinomycetota bacterium]
MTFAKRTRLLSLLALLLAVGLVAVACGDDAATTTTGAATTTTGAAVAPTKVASVAGGPHPFFDPWGPGTNDAVRDFGLAGGTYQFPPQWELTAQNNMVETLVAQGYNAFVIFPGDATGTNALLGELLAQGIPSIAGGGCTSEPSPAAFCLATDVGNSAYIGTRALIAAMGDTCTAADPCQIVHIASRLVDPNTQARIAAVDRAVGETNGTVRVLQHLTDSDDQEAATEKVGAILASSGAEIDGMISVAYVGSSVAATLLRNLGDKRIKMIGIDDDPEVLRAIEDGFLVGTMSQNPYGQAYLGSWVLDKIRHGCTVKDGAPFLVDSGTFLITADGANVGDVPSTAIAEYVEKRVNITNELKASFEASYLSCP